MHHTRCFTQHHRCVIINISTERQSKETLYIFIVRDADFILFFFFKEKQLLNFNQIIYGQTGEDGKIVSEKYEGFNHPSRSICPSEHT